MRSPAADIYRGHTSHNKYKWMEDLFGHHAYTPSQSAAHTLGENPDAWPWATQKREGRHSSYYNEQTSLGLRASRPLEVRPWVAEMCAGTFLKAWCYTFAAPQTMYNVRRVNVTAGVMGVGWCYSDGCRSSLLRHGGGGGLGGEGGGGGGFGMGHPGHGGESGGPRGLGESGGADGGCGDGRHGDGSVGGGGLAGRGESGGGESHGGNGGGEVSGGSAGHRASMTLWMALLGS